MVEKVFCRLSGREPPVFPSPDGETRPKKEIQNVKGKEKEAANENDKEKENSPSTWKKRSFNEMNAEGGGCEAGSRSDNIPAKLEESTESPQLSLKK